MMSLFKSLLRQAEHRTFGFILACPPSHAFTHAFAGTWALHMRTLEPSRAHQRLAQTTQRARHPAARSRLRWRAGSEARIWITCT
eukprot:3681315-Pleurochrysis_carterae.AAC.1